MGINCIPFPFMLSAALWPVLTQFSIFRSQLCTHILIKMHSSLLRKTLYDTGIPTHYWEVNGTMMLHCLSLVTLTLSAVKLFHFTLQYFAFITDQQKSHKFISMLIYLGILAIYS